MNIGSVALTRLASSSETGDLFPGAGITAEIVKQPILGKSCYPWDADANMRNKCLIILALLILLLLVAIRRPSESSLRFNQQQHEIAKPQVTR